MGFKDLLKSITGQGAGETIQLTPQHIDGNFLYLATGTTHRQPTLSKLGYGSYEFALTPEIGNQYDAEAVKVDAIIDGKLAQVGYVPAKSAEKAVIHKLGLLSKKQGTYLTVTGEVKQGESGFIVQLSMPHISDLRKMLAEKDGSFATATASKSVVPGQAEARAALAASPNKFMAAELENRVYSSGGGYLVKPLPADLKNANLFANKYVSEWTPFVGVAYLVPEGSDQIAVQIDGLTVDHLTKQAVKLLGGRIVEPVPVKCEVEWIVGRNNSWPHIKLSKFKKFKDD